MSDMHIIRPEVGSKELVQPTFCSQFSFNIETEHYQFTDYNGINERNEVPTCQACIAAAIDGTDDAVAIIEEQSSVMKEQVASYDAMVTEFKNVVSKLKAFRRS